MASYFGKAQGAFGEDKVVSCSNDRLHGKGYADGGPVKVNTFRSAAEKKVDAIYGPQQRAATTNPVAQPNAATQRLDKKIQDAEDPDQGVRG